MVFLTAHWAEILTTVLTVAELVSLFVKGNGTIAGLITALKSLGAKDVDGQ